MPKFSPRSILLLNQAHPDLRRVFELVIQHRDCQVTCGWRSKEDQEAAFKSKHSKAAWPTSKHNVYPAYAVDVIPLHSDAPKVRWEDLESFKLFANFVLGVGVGLGIEIEWGGNWTSFKDYPHFQLKGLPDSPQYEKPKDDNVA